MANRLLLLTLCLLSACANEIKNDGVHWNGHIAGPYPDRVTNPKVQAFLQARAPRSAMSVSDYLFLKKLLAERDTFVAAHILLTRGTGYRLPIELEPISFHNPITGKTEKVIPVNFNGLIVDFGADGRGRYSPAQFPEIRQLWLAEIDRRLSTKSSPQPSAD